MRDVTGVLLGFARTLRYAGVDATPERVQAMFAAVDALGVVDPSAVTGHIYKIFFSPNFSETEPPVTTVVGADKGKGKKAFLGQDSVDWVAVIAACRDFGGTEWITLEQEAYPDGKTPMECSAISFAALKKLV